MEENGESLHDDGVSAEEWTREVSTLAHISDVLMSIRSVLVQAHSSNHRAPNWQAFPRPSTAMDKARSQLVVKRHHERVAMLMPKPREE